MIEQYQHKERLIKVVEVAELCGCSVATVWRRARSGLMPPPVKIGGTTRWSLIEISNYLQTQLDSRMAINEAA